MSQATVALIHALKTSGGDLSGVRAALDAGADVNACVDNVTPLYVAVRCGNEACVRALLAAGADPNFREPECGCTPLIAAAKAWYPQNVFSLLTSGADANAADFDGHTALHMIASNSGCLNSTRALLDRAPQTNLARSYLHRLPLDECLSFGNFDMACVLLEQPLRPPTDEVLSALIRARNLYAIPDDLFVCCVRSTALTPSQWACIPRPCELVRALPFVFTRSEREVSSLMQCLPIPHRRCIQVSLMCIRHVERKTAVSLPSDVLLRILSISV